MKDQEDLMRQFPLITAADDFTRYSGFIQLEEEYYKIYVHVPNYPSLIDITVKGSGNISALFKESEMEQRLLSETLCSVLENIRKNLILQKKIKLPNWNFDERLISSETFKLLMSDLNKIGLSNVKFMSQCLSKFQLRSLDRANREHILSVNISKSSPLKVTEIEADLPEEALEKVKENTLLEEIYKSFLQKIDDLQNIWNALEVIDAHCYVLEPEHATKKDIGRRIMIDRNISIYLRFNNHVETIPSITVLGPEKAVQHFQSVINKNSQMWQPSENVLDNLKCMLELTTLPEKTNVNEHTSLIHQGECSICFSLYMDEELPSIICEHALCESAFHSPCLFQWLQAVPGNYQSFDSMHGACPNCSMPISCPIPRFK